MAAASGDSNSLISSGASWRDKLQIPKPIANATAIRTAVKTRLPVRLESGELSRPWKLVSAYFRSELYGLLLQSRQCRNSLNVLNVGLTFSQGSCG